jgi:hypothetical protein
MRAVVLLLVVFVTTSPFAGVVGLGEAPEPCPMSVAMPDGAPCLMAPCPCDHTTPPAVAPQSAPTTLPLAQGAAAPTPTRRTCLPAAQPPLAAGFPHPIDRPPTTRA